MSLLFELFRARMRGDVGGYGEALTDYELRLIALRGCEGITLRNLYIPKDNGETSEADMIYITRKGIFVIESKNYSGWIYGAGDDRYWTKLLPDGKKVYFYNPIRQNKTHIRWLSRAAGRKIPMISVIVFSERCKLKKVKFREENTYVCKRNRLARTVRKCWKRLDDVLTPEQTEQLAEKLRPLTKPGRRVRRAHVQDVERIRKEELICPECGSPLVLRTAKKGAYAGRQFYGCSAFPKCRYISDITPAQ